MIPVAWILSVTFAFVLGYHYKELTSKVKLLKEAIESKVDKQPEPEEPKSMVIDPLDEVQTAQYEHEQLMKRLNPNG